VESLPDAPVANDDTEQPSVEELRQEVQALARELQARVEAKLGKPTRLNRLSDSWERLGWWNDPAVVRLEWDHGLRHLNEVRLRLLDTNPLNFPEKGACSVCGRTRGDMDPKRAAEHTEHFMEALGTAWKPVAGE
jgi:hypothetical protein